MMIVKGCRGESLVKTIKASPEEAFHRSMVTFERNGKERTFHLLYLRCFEEEMSDFTPFTEDPIFIAGERKVCLKDIAALAAMIRHPEYEERKRVYLHEKEDFIAIFRLMDVESIQNIFKSLEKEDVCDLGL